MDESKVEMRPAPRSRAAAAAILCLLLAAWQAAAQTMTTTIQNSADGVTPAALTPGAPAGAYTLTDFESINLYNGHLSIALPILTVGGRGEAGYTMIAQVTRPPWTVDNTVEQVDDNPASYRFTSNVSPTWWDPFETKYGPGLVMEKRWAGNPGYCAQTSTWHYTKSFTYFVFRAPDGSEHALYDTSGKNVLDPGSACGAAGLDPTARSRGNVFEARDGSGLTFHSSVEVIDNLEYTSYGEDAGTKYGGNGELLFPNGVRYAIAFGLVTSIKDRNGNTVSISYVSTTNLVSQVTDSLGRTVTVQYNYLPGTYPDGCDRITFKGAGGTDREILIVYRHVENVLRSGENANTILFDDIDDWTVSRYDLHVVSSIVLPNGTSYGLLYNPYAEVARITLPTGGAMEYDHGAGVEPDSNKGAYGSGQLLSAFPSTMIPSADPSMPWRPSIYRRLLTRRTYLSTLNGTVSGTATYSRLEHPTSATTYSAGVYNSIGISQDTSVTVTRHDGLRSSPDVVTEHSFHDGGWQGVHPYGSYGPARTLLYSTPDQTSPSNPFEGKEYQTETPDLQRVTRVYGIINQSQMTIAACQEKTTLIGTGTTSGKVLFHEPTFLNLTDVCEYDYNGVDAPTIQTATHNGLTYNICPSTAPGGYTRRTHTDYVTDSGYTGTTVHLRDLPSAVKTYDSVSTVKAETHYYYDQQTEGTECNYQPGVADASGITGHDSGYGTSYTTRGNLKCTARWLNSPSSQWLVTKNQHDIAGNVVLTQDPRGNSTQYSYASSCSYGPSNTYAFLTEVTNALYRAVSTRYDCWLGKPDQITDASNAVTTLVYNDTLDRLTSAIEPEGRQTSYLYSGLNDPLAVDATTAGVHNRIESDGLGRQTASILYGDGGAIVSRSDTQYDGLGRVWKVSNPYKCAASNCTGSELEARVWTETTYDAGGRLTRVTHPESSYIDNTYAGNQITVRDESGKKRRNITDALGRLTQVVENPDAEFNMPAYSTSYAYNALDNLLSVTQGDQPRNFTYDSLGRLLTATNPESGMTSYQYDSNGNLVKKTDALSKVTCFGDLAGTNCDSSGTKGYDALNRPKKKAYSDATTPTVTYTYDTVKLGRLSTLSTSVSATNHTAYDGLGRVTAGNQNTGGTTYPFGYGYNALGLTSITYPSGRTVSYTYDGAGRTLTAAGSLGSETHTYASEVTYEPHGGMHEWRRTYTPTGGSQYNIVEDHTYNSRLQPAAVSLTANSTQRLALGFDYGTTGNNGNLLQQTIAVPGASPASQVYSYDAVNRLSGASEGSAWSRTFGYDAYGNMWVSTASGIPAASFTPQSSAWFGANNQLVNGGLGIDYDDGGALTQIGGYGFTYDAEGRLKTSTINGITTEYFYDGEGRRVKKTTDGNTTVYAYDAFGKLAAQYGGTADGGGTQYLTTDHLGSTRLMTDAAGSVVKRYDYLPFGEEIPWGIGFRTTGLGYGSDSFPLKFTGKERDTESNLDYFGARYFSGAQGRFTSPDPFSILMEAEDRDEFDAYISNPQNWNRYVYTWNNPLRYVDPDGERVYVVAYTTGNPEGDEEFKKVAETLARQIQNSKGFDAKKDTVVVRGVGSKDDFKSLITGANRLEKQFGKVEGVSLVSHGGPADGPIFPRPDASGTRQFLGGERELGGLTVNWAQSGEARFYGCNTAVAFCQRFANAQGVPAWGFNTYSSFSGDPNSKSKWYLLNPWNRDLYSIGRDGSGMVRRNPTRPRR